MKTSILTIFVAGFVLASGKANHHRMQLRGQQGVGGGPIVLDHEDGVTANSSIFAVCTGATVALQLTSSIEGLAQVTIGDGTQSACLKSDIAVPTVSETVISTTNEQNCNGRGSATEGYTWDVKVFEEEVEGSGDDLALGRYYEFDIRVFCEASLADPNAEAVTPLSATIKPEGQGDFGSTVPFTLKKNNSSTSRLWILDLYPTDAAQLDGLSYTIGTCTASTTGRPATEGVAAVPAQSSSFIVNGCIKERTTRVATIGNVNTITIAAFRFKNDPNAEVNIKCSVNMCNPPALNGHCAGVFAANSAECSGTRSRRSLENILHASNKLGSTTVLAMKKH